MKLHTTVLIGGTRLARVLNFLALVLLACFAAGLSANAAPPTGLSSNRFLFIIDASASMKPLEKALNETIFDAIYSGLRGRMTNGDSFGVWFVRDQNDTSYPINVWRARFAVEAGAKVTTHLKERGFKGGARLDLALADVLRVVQSVRDVTIVLVSNGETPIAGTPFDDAINARFRELAPAMKRAKATLNTVLVAQDGALVAWAANTPEFLIDVPYVAPKPKSAKTQIATVTANETMATNARSAPVESTSMPRMAAEKPRVASNPIIITKETVAKEKRAWAAMTSTATNEPIPSAPTNELAGASANTNTNTVVSTSNSVPALPSHVSTPSITTNAAAVSQLAAVTAPRPVPKSHREPSNRIATTPTIESAEVDAHAGVPEPTATAAVPAARSRTEQNRSGFQPLVWITAGAALAVLCVLVGVLVARGQRREASLISQAINQQRAHTS